tara:strand:- start:794 stop:1177 length:384 start_codon:yes stop_codon:yes gene_type:complete
MLWAQTTTPRRRDARFQQLVLDSTIGQLALHEFDGLAEAHGPELQSRREELIKAIVESVRASLLDQGVPEGFHNHAMRLHQHDAATGFKPPLNCLVCGTVIQATRDYACSIKRPSCRPCASAEQGCG